MKFYEAVVTLKDDKVETRVEPFRLFDFLKNEDYKKYDKVEIEYMMHELNCYHFIVFAKSEDEVINRLNYYLITEGLSKIESK